MVTVNETWVRMDDLRTAKAAAHEAPTLAPGEVLFRIDQAGLTANNVTYAVAGHMIGYWGFFPTGEEGWGKVPVWGYATAVESRCEGIEVGEEIYGYWPMASHCVLAPAAVRAGGFVDGAPHRKALPALYNQYNRKSAEPDFLAGMQTERCIYFPLFVTSYLLYDYLESNAFFGAGQVVIGSASSKTGFGLAHAISRSGATTPPVIGFTSPGNLDFTQGLGVYDEVRLYGEEARLDAEVATAYVDMSGDGRLTRALHTHFGEKLVESCMVGITHWEAMEPGLKGLPGAEPTMFFAPGQIEKRDAEWGRGVVMERALAACADMAKEARAWVTAETVTGAGDIQSAWTSLVEGGVAPSKAMVITY
ncbi:MAG: DUF2855 family protein [Pseudomonadota bacterium]